MFVAGPHVPYPCEPLECAAPRRAPILHVGDAMAERARSARKGASAAGRVPAPVAPPETIAGMGERAVSEVGRLGTTAPRAMSALPAGPDVEDSSTAGKPSGAPAAGTAPEPGSAAGTLPNTDQAPPIAARVAAKGATMGKPADTKTTATKQAPAGEAKATKVAPKTTRTAAETEKIRVALAARRDELKEEYDATISEITELQRDRLTDSAGDDQADTGTKTFEREQEISLANSILERVTQVERALERLDEGSYGWCERCGNPIPVERLAAFPSATLCVTCKQLEERR